MPDWIADKLKAVVAGVVGFGATWVAKKWGFDVSAEMQATIIGAIMAIAVWAFPNKTA